MATRSTSWSEHGESENEKHWGRLILLILIGFCLFSQLFRGFFINDNILGNEALSVNFESTGQIIALGNTDGTVRVWDMAADHEQDTVRVCQGRIECMAFSLDGRTLAFGMENGGLKIWG